MFTTAHNGIWDAEKKAVVTYGTGDEVWHVTTYSDAAKYTIEILQLPGIEKGGFFSVAGFAHSTREIARIYGDVRSIDVPVKLRGDVEDLRNVAMAARESGNVRRYWEYIGTISTSCSHWMGLGC